MTCEYKPNFKNAKVRKRAELVLNWGADYLIGKFGTDLPLRLSAKGFKNLQGKHVPGLNDIFGPKGNDLGDYLRNELLILVSKSYRPGEHSMSYRLSREGYERVQAEVSANGESSKTVYGDTRGVVLSVPEPKVEPLDRLVLKHAEELQTLTFAYKDRSNRLWHGLQNIPRAQKTPFWQKFGLPFDYDIEACAPTVLFNLARQAGLPAVLLETLKNYLDDRTGFRTHVASLTGLSNERSKQLINSLFNGAKLGKNSQFSTFRLLDFDGDRMDALTSDSKVMRLVQEIRRVWKRIESNRALTMRPSLTERLSGNDSSPWKLSSSKLKWQLYFEQERLILDVISDYLSARGVHVFTEHDGFRTDQEIDVPALERQIFAQTGLEMKIQMKDQIEAE